MSEHRSILSLRAYNVFRMKALQEGDKFIVKRLVRIARSKVLKELIIFMLVYIFLVILTAWLIYEFQSNQFFDDLDILVIVIEIFKMVIDEILFI